MFPVRCGGWAAQADIESAKAEMALRDQAASAKKDPEVKA